VDDGSSSDPTFVATQKQVGFAEAVFSGLYRYLAYGGAIRGGKSFIVVALLFVLCRVYPRSRWAIVRMDLPTLRRNTVPTIEKLRPPRFCAALNQSTWSYRCRNGSEILLFAEGIRDDPDLDRWKGLEVNGFVLEEANELAEKSWFKSIERAGTWIIPPTKDDPTPAQPDPLILLTFNPALAWVKWRFYDRYKAGTLVAPFFYQPATVADNPHVGAAFRESLKNLPEREYKRFVEGEWEATDEPDQLIKSEWVYGALEVVEIPGKRRLAVDVARYGDDDTVLAFGEGNSLTEMEPHHGLSIDRTSTVTALRITEGPIDADEVRVDGVGMGAGVVDNLHRDGFQVQDVIAGASPLERNLDPDVFQDDTVFQFYDLRSQMWWTVRERLRLGKIRIPKALLELHPRLFEDLTAPRYEIRADKKLKVESKDEIKKRIGRSTDYGDAFVMLFAEVTDRVPLLV
jgi:hypothetical protein